MNQTRITDQVRLNACPRCDGSVFEWADQYGRYYQCPFCGHHIDIAVPAIRPVNPIHYQRQSTAGRKHCKTKKCNKLVPLNDDGTISARRLYCCNTCKRRGEGKKAGVI